MSYSTLNFVLRKTPNLLYERVQAFVILTMNEPNVGCIKGAATTPRSTTARPESPAACRTQHPDDLHQDFHLENFPVER